MPFNDKKCKVIAFGSQNYRPTSYKLGEAEKDWTDTTTYLGVVMQSNLKFNQHIALKKDKASKTPVNNQVHSKTSPTRRLVTGLH